MWICRRRTEALLGALLLLVSAPALGFGWAETKRAARDRAAAPYDPPPALPEWLRDMTGDAWNRIRSDPRRALRAGADAPFSITLHHPGGLYQQPVQVHRIRADGGVRTVKLDREAFYFGPGTRRERAPDDLGHAGVSVHWRTPSERNLQVAQFLGGSFMRAGAPDFGGGTRVRAATVDVALPRGEEFPFFTDLYLDLADPKARTLTVYAVVDSPRLTGALRYRIRPQADRTRTDVDGVLYAREAIEKVGIGALDTLYYHGEERARPAGEWRPEVHSADRLILRSPGGIFVARPLANPKQLAIENFAPPRPQPYGLIQRDRRPDHYQDLGQKLEQRPNAWLRPGPDFPDGMLELLELPLEDPVNHNVLAHWVVDSPPRPDQPLSFSYSLDWGLAEPLPEALGRVVAARNTTTGRPDPVLIVQLDFAGEPRDLEAPVRAQGLALEGGRIVAHSLVRDDALGVWRLTLRVAPERRAPVVLEARLVQGDEVLTETWHGVFGAERLP